MLGRLFTNCKTCSSKKDKALTCSVPKTDAHLNFKEENKKNKSRGNLFQSSCTIEVYDSFKRVENFFKILKKIIM